MESDVNTWKITEGIVKKLKEEFGDGYTVYADSVPQNFHTPSFYVRQVSGEFLPQRGRRYTLNSVIAVTYFPTEHAADEQKEILSVLSRLYPILEYIPGADGLPIRAGSLSHEITDHELHMSLSYAVSVFRTWDRGEYMRVLQQVQHVKEG